MDGTADVSFNYDGFLGHETKFGLECSKCMIKGFQLLDNFMLIISPESPDIGYLLNRVPLSRLTQAFSNVEEKNPTGEHCF